MMGSLMLCADVTKVISASLYQLELHHVWSREYQSPRRCSSQTISYSLPVWYSGFQDLVSPLQLFLVDRPEFSAGEAY